MRTLLLAGSALALLATPAFAATPDLGGAPSGTYTLDKAHASITWKVDHLGLSMYTARFTRFDATIELDADNPANSTISVSIDPTSVKTDYVGESDFDGKLATGAEWFNAGDFPAITFTSREVRLLDETTGVVTGDLAFLGQTAPLSLNVTFNGGTAEKPFAGVPALGFSATTVVDRSVWGFDTYEPNIGGDVSVLIETEFHKEG